MATLPSITVNDKQLTSVMAVFDNDPAKYREWLRASLRSLVIQQRTIDLDVTQQAERAALEAAIDSEVDEK